MEKKLYQKVWGITASSILESNEESIWIIVYKIWHTLDIYDLQLASLSFFGDISFSALIKLV